MDLTRVNELKTQEPLVNECVTCIDSMNIFNNCQNTFETCEHFCLYHCLKIVIFPLYPKQQLERLDFENPNPLVCLQRTTYRFQGSLRVWSIFGRLKNTLRKCLSIYSPTSRQTCSPNSTENNLVLLCLWLCCCFKKKSLGKRLCNLNQYLVND